MLDFSKYLSQLNWRYATKKFDTSKKIPAQDLQEILEATRLSPSSFGIQPWKIIVVSNPEIKQKLLPEAYNQEQITTCSDLIVLASRKGLTEEDINQYAEDIKKTRGVSQDDIQGFVDAMMAPVKNKTEQELTIWNQRQVYIALGFLLTAAAQKGIDSCPMEGFNSQGFDKILGLDAKGYTSTVICPLGYRATDDMYANLPKVRFDKDKVFEFVK
jgi:nitroreductase